METNRKRKCEEDDFPTDLKDRSTHPIVLKSDHFSDLIDDCLLDVFERLDHNDLDEIALLSKKMERLSGLSRQRAVKVKADELCVTQTNEFLIRMGSNMFCLDGLNIDSELFKATHSMNNRFELDHPALLFTDRATVLMKRFEFGQCHFINIIIDRTFLKFLEHVKFKSFLIQNSVFEMSMDSNAKIRFLTILLAAKPKTIGLDLNNIISFIDEDFLRNFSQSVHLPKFTANFLSASSTFLLPNKSFLETLSRFRSITTYVLVIDPKWLIDAVIMRLREKIYGFWQFRITRDITRIEIERYIEPDLKHCPVDQSTRTTTFYHRIEITGTSYKVIMKCQKSENYPIFQAIFNDEM